MTPTIVFVHGAFSTPNAFNYFRTQLTDFPQLSFSYDWNDRTSKVGSDLATYVVNNVTTDTVVLLGHSLGGNVSLHSLKHFHQHGAPTVKHVCTYGSPFGGSRYATVVGLFSKAPIFDYIAPSSSEIRSLKKIARDNTNITSFVTTRGPLSTNNDGVVTVASQTTLPGVNYINVATNHMEVLLSDHVIAATRQFIEH
jgi:pimeloyl-ACP methyl ester carboxylesterase